MQKSIKDFIVSDNSPVNDHYFLLKLKAEDKLQEIQPGQFVEVRIDSSCSTFLRRPFSVHYVDKAANELWLLIQKVGDGTHKLSEIKEGDSINLVFPLGNSFSLPSADQKKMLLIGGGVGVAPLLMLGSYLKEKGYEPHFLLGARSKKDLVQLNEFGCYGKVYTTTEDNSFGEEGFVTQHSVLKEKWDKIYTCGPTPMMKAVAAFAKQNRIDCEVSLENTMACGIGACLCCVTDTKDGHKCVCTDGPVFNINKLKWQI
jgi:dihydroorotate dehydrogenase electron transfer subunit